LANILANILLCFYDTLAVFLRYILPRFYDTQVVEAHLFKEFAGDFYDRELRLMLTGLGLGVRVRV
jgi:hypothetical protein